MPGQKDGRKDRQTLFYRNMPATAASPTTNFKSGAATTNAGTITTSTKGAAKVTVTKLQH